MSSSGSTGHFGRTHGQTPCVLGPAPQAAPLAAEPAARGLRPPLIWLTALAGLAVAVLIGAFGFTSGDVASVEVVLYEWMSVTYIVAGLVAKWRRPDSRLGALMIAGGLGTGLAGLQFAQHDVPSTIGVALDLLPVAVFLHLFLAFPDGRLRSRFERVLVVAAYAVAVGAQVLRLSLGPSGTLLADLWSLPEVASDLRRVQLLVASAMLLIGTGILAARRRRAGRPRRRALALVIDLFALGMLLAAALLTDAAFYGPAIASIQRATWTVVGLAPIVFLIGLLDARLARSDVGSLIIALRKDLPPAELRDALARTLRDPSLSLAYRLPDSERYVDLAGRPVEVPGPGEGRATTSIDHEGAHVAALLHHPSLLDEPELLDAVTAAASIALEHGRLQAELAARLEEVRGSHVRVMEAATKERQRLERNLHDGAQQRLVALTLQLRLLELQLGDRPDAREQLDEAQREIALSLSELRDLAHGLHPAVVTSHGLAVALEQVAARAPVPVQLTVDLDDRLADQIEVAAYYVVTESLANIAKHAQATRAGVEIGRTGDGVLVEIVDDGVGGADTADGSGLRGLADRVEALGGRLRVSTPDGGGTCVRAEIPCP